MVYCLFGGAYLPVFSTAAVPLRRATLSVRVMLHCFAEIALISGFLGGGEMCFFGGFIGLEVNGVRIFAVFDVDL